MDNPASPYIANARLHCRELGPVAPPFFIMPPPQNYPAFPLPFTILGPRPSGFGLFVTAAQPTSHLTPYSSQHPTPPLTPNRNNMPRIRTRRDNRKRYARTLPKPYTESSTPARRMIGHPPCTNCNRYFRSLPALSSLKIFWSYHPFS